jgi:hypothetical protein
MMKTVSLASGMEDLKDRMSSQIAAAQISISS